MVKATQKRAAKGGQIGVNGEFYKGGAFIATTDCPKSEAKKQGRGKQEYTPYKWEFPQEGQVAIYHLLKPFAVYIDWNAARSGEAKLIDFSNNPVMKNLPGSRQILLKQLLHKYVKEQYWISEDNCIVQSISASLE